jgi:hypothetical protein
MSAIDDHYQHRHHIARRTPGPGAAILIIKRSKPPSKLQSAMATSEAKTSPPSKSAAKPAEKPESALKSFISGGIGGQSVSFVKK